MRAALIGAIFLAVGCKEKLPLEVGRIDFDYGFLLTYPTEGPPLRASGVFGVSEEGEVIFGDQPALVLEDGEERFVFVALDGDQLHPSFERARADELDAIIEPPPAGLEVEGSGNTELRAKTKLPESAQLLTRDLEGSEEELRPVREAEFDLFDEVTLRMPVEPEHCRIIEQTAPVPFGAKAQVLPAQASLRWVENAYYLDQDRILVATRAYVYLLERGGTITTTIAPSIWGLFQDARYSSFDRIFDLGIGPPAADGTIPLVAVGGDTLDENPRYGRIWPLRFNGTSIAADGPSVRTAGLQNFSATFTPDGRAWVGGPDGVIFIRAPGETEFSVAFELEHRTDLKDLTYELLPIDVGGYTMMAGFKNHLHLYGPGGWEYQYLMRSGLLGPEGLRWSSLAAIDGEFWAAGDRGQIARKRRDEEWLLFSENGEDLIYPPRFLPCASSDDPAGNALGFNRMITAIEIAGDYLHMGHQNCNALVVMRRADRCVSLVPPAGAEVEFSLSYVTSIHRLGNRLLLGYSGGELYETILP